MSALNIAVAHQVACWLLQVGADADVPWIRLVSGFLLWRAGLLHAHGGRRQRYALSRCLIQVVYMCARRSVHVCAQGCTCAHRAVHVICGSGGFVVTHILLCLSVKGYDFRFNTKVYRPQKKLYSAVRDHHFKRTYMYVQISAFQTYIVLVLTKYQSCTKNNVAMADHTFASHMSSMIWY